MSPEEFLDFDQALAKLGITDADLNRRIQNGEIKAHQFGGIRKLAIADVEELKKRIDSGSDSTVLETDIFGSADDVLDLASDENLDAELGLSFDEDVDETGQTIISSVGKKKGPAVPAKTSQLKSDSDDTQSLNTQELSFDDSDDLEILPYESGEDMKKTVGFTVASTDATHDDLSLQPDDESQVQKTTNFNVSALETNLERTAIEQTGVDATAVDMGSTKSATRLDKSSTRSATAVSKTMRSQVITGLEPLPTVAAREVQIQPAWMLVSVVCAISLIWCCGVVLSFVSGNTKEKTLSQATNEQMTHELRDLELVYGVQNHEIRTLFTNMSKGSETAPGMEAWGENPYKYANDIKDKLPEVQAKEEEKKPEDKEATEDKKDEKKDEKAKKKKSEDDEEDEEDAPKDEAKSGDKKTDKVEKEEKKSDKKDDSKKEDTPKDDTKKDDAKKEEPKDEKKASE